MLSVAHTVPSWKILCEMAEEWLFVKSLKKKKFFLAHVKVILTENLGMRHVSAKTLSQLLTQEEKETDLSEASDTPECA
jgi:hypothetical protein